MRTKFYRRLLAPSVAVATALGASLAGYSAASASTPSVDGGWVKSDKVVTAKGNHVTTFTKGNDKVKWAQNSDQDLAIEATFTPATATTPGTAHTVIKPAGKTPTNAEVEAKGGPAKKTAEEAAEQMIEQLQTVSGMSRDDAKAWLGDMLPKLTPPAVAGRV